MSHESADKLLPCPFCGDAPSLQPEHPEYQGSAWGAVECVNPSCVTFDDALDRGVRVLDGEFIADERGSDQYIAAAIARWNRRAYTSHEEC